MPNPYSLLTAADFQLAAMNLLPRGRAYTRDLNSTLAKFFGAIADLLTRFHSDASNIVDTELYPPATQAMLAEWEADFGLPDPCTPQPQTYEQRIAALLARITDQGSLSRAKYIALAAALGFEITITEFEPTTCTDDCTDPILEIEWRFAWQVNAPETTVTELTCIGDCVSPLRSWGNEPLECALRGANRPSRSVLFSYAS